MPYKITKQIISTRDKKYEWTLILRVSKGESWRSKRTKKRKPIMDELQN